MSPSQQISTLLAWCSNNGIEIDPRLQIKHAEHFGVSVFSRDAHIGVPTTLVQIPKTAVLSVKSCSLSNVITHAPYGHDAILALSLALFGELLKQDRSRWYGYLQSLPKVTVDIAILWGVEPDDKTAHQNEMPETIRRHRLCLQDCNEALSWIRGTELETELRKSGEGFTSSLEEIRYYYVTVAEPILSMHHLLPSLGGFYRAYSLVSSRAFLVDAYHNLAMVPIADAFNHSLENQVHLESDFTVCQVCGSFGECPHDQMDMDINSHRAAAINSMSSSRIPPGCQEIHVADTYDMVSNAAILPHTEVFNTYGETLTNAQLLAQYGFAVDGNDNEYLTWNMGDLRNFAVQHVQLGGGSDFNADSADHVTIDVLMEIWQHIVHLWPNDPVWEDSDLVYNPVVPKASGRASEGTILHVNGDAKITHHLWLFCALLNMVDARDHQVRKLATAGIVSTTFDLDTPSSETRLRLLRQAADLQVAVEGRELSDNYPDACESVIFDGDSRDINAGQVNNNSSSLGPVTIAAPSLQRSPLVILCNTIHTIVALMTFRRERIGKMGACEAHVEDLGEFVDSLPSHMIRTKLALTQVLSELSILQSCGTCWSEIGGILAGDH